MMQSILSCNSDSRNVVFFSARKGLNDTLSWEECSGIDTEFFSLVGRSHLCVVGSTFLRSLINAQ